MFSYYFIPPPPNIFLYPSNFKFLEITFVVVQGREGEGIQFIDVHRFIHSLSSTNPWLIQTNRILLVVGF